MPFQEPKFPEFKRGMGLSAELLNRMKDAIPRQLRGSGDVEIRDFGDRTIIGGSSSGPILPMTQNYVDQFIVVQEFANYLQCALPIWNEAISEGNTPGDWVVGPTIYVAKPYLLQQYPLGSAATQWYEAIIQSINYTDVNRREVTGLVQLPSGGPSINFFETQVITPQYQENELIMAVQTRTGLLTDNSNANNPGQPSTSIPIIWMDLNTAARAWALDVNVVGG